MTNDEIAAAEKDAKTLRDAYALDWAARTIERLVDALEAARGEVESIRAVARTASDNFECLAGKLDNIRQTVLMHWPVGASHDDE